MEWTEESKNKTFSEWLSPNAVYTYSWEYRNCKHCDKKLLLGFQCDCEIKRHIRDLESKQLIEFI